MSRRPRFLPVDCPVQSSKVRAGAEQDVDLGRVSTVAIRGPSAFSAAGADGSPGGGCPARKVWTTFFTTAPSGSVSSFLNSIAAASTKRHRWSIISVPVALSVWMADTLAPADAPLATVHRTLATAIRTQKL